MYGNFPLKCYRPLLTLALSCGALGASPALRAQGTPVQSQALPDASPQSISQLAGRPISEIRIVSSSGEMIAENRANLPLKVGDGYDDGAVRAAIRVLIASGDYQNVTAEVTPQAAGLRLDFVVERTLFIAVVDIEGIHAPPSDAAAFAAMRLRVGDPFSQAGLADAVENLRQALIIDGLYQAKISTSLSPQPAQRQMNIFVNVQPGERARAGKISIKNTTPFADEDLLSRIKLRTGDQFDSAKLKRGEDRVRKYLVKQDYLGARVNFHRGTYDPATNSMPFELETIAGPRVRVVVTGAKIPNKELKRRVPVFEEGAVDPDLLAEGRRNLRDYFESRGYYETAVDYTSSEQTAPAKSGGPATAEEVITYEVARTKKQHFVGVAFEGNHYFSGEQLRGRLTIQPAAFATPGRFSQRLLDADAAAVRDLYVANGFQNAAVTTHLEQDYHGKSGDLFVHFAVSEGAQTLVGRLDIDGNASIKLDDLLAVVGSTAGEPYSDFNVATDRDNILALYFNEGFPGAHFTAAVSPIADAQAPASTPNAGPNPEQAAQTPADAKANSSAAAVNTRPRVALVYHIEEGEQIRISEILIAGYDHTRRGVIGREIRVKAGGPLREGEVIETQRRLYDLGVFTRVAVAPQNPGGADPEKALDVVVDEAKRYTIGYGGGFEVQRLSGSGNVTGSFTASPRATFEFTKLNLTGRADTLSFKIRASTLQGRALLSYQTQNYFGKPNFSLQMTVFADKSRDVTTFTSTRYEGTVQLTQKYSRATSFLYRYSYRLVRVSDLQIEQQLIPLFSQPTQVSEFGFTWIRERRDNPADATHGSYNSADFAIAGKPIGSSASFGRFFLQNSTYYTLSPRFIFARSLQFGIQETIGNTLSSDIPLPERFFAGGGNSLRGFGLNEAGPRDPVTGFPVGGQALVIFQQEMRFPMHLPKLGTKLGGALFYDAGNVFSRLGAFTLRSTPTAAETSSGDLAYFSHTIGLGLRYATPIGPVRVDFGYQINPAQFFAQCTVGPACPTGTQLTRLPHFQFFFNLGSVF